MRVLSVGGINSWPGREKQKQLLVKLGLRGLSLPSTSVVVETTQTSVSISAAAVKELENT